MFRLPLSLVVLFGGMASLPAQTPPLPGKVVPATLPSAISPSGQFTIYGGTSALRGDFLTRCEALSRDLAAVTGQGKSRWIHPCVIELTVPESSKVVQRRASARVFALDPQGYRLQLYLLIDDEFQLDEFEHAFIRLLLIERMLRSNRPEADVDRLPAWMLAGVAGLIEYRRAGRPSDVFSALMDARQIPPVSEVIAGQVAEITDSVSRGIHQACSAALVQALLDQATGPARFQAMLEDLAYSKAPVAELLRTHFPAIDQAPEALAKWWTLQLASMSERSAYELLSPAETERLLQQALVIDFPESDSESPSRKPERRTPNPGRLRVFPRKSGEQAREVTTFANGTLEDFANFVRDPRSPTALRQCEERLNKLTTRCFPLHRPIIASYGRVISRLLGEETAGIAEELDSLRKRRSELTSLMGGVSDYMNWYVTTQVQEASDDFNGYAEALKTLERLESRRRRDPVTTYLDAMERELAP